MSKLSSEKKAAAAKAKISKQDGKWLASDPSSLEAVLAELKQAKSWSQGQEALIAIFTALLKE
ncbi:MAG: hypothetical protein KQH53_11310 [Desulfarculaceae bacterium]|nr:hypothetical protein [Desulfarculaceae bacterium]